MTTATAIVTKEGKTITRIPNAINYKGCVIQKLSGGNYRPFFDKTAACLDGFEEMKAFIDDKKGIVKKADLPQLEKYCIRWGENSRADGSGKYEVITAEEQEGRQEKQVLLKKQQEAEKEGYVFEVMGKHTSYDEDGPTPAWEYRITHKESGREFVFSDRNIFDFGRVLNPVSPVDGGIMLNVENFIEKNPYTFKDDEVKEKYRREHPTETGYGYDRSYCDGEQWVAVDEIEVQAFKLAAKLGYAYEGIRM